MIIYERFSEDKHSHLLDDIINLYRELDWWAEKADNKAYLKQIISGSFFFVVAIEHIHYNQTVLVGFGRIISDQKSDAYIQDVGVHKTYQGQHVGQNIMNTLLDFCRQNNLGWIGLIAAPKTAPFYEKLGFQVMKDFTPMIYTIKG